MTLALGTAVNKEQWLLARKFGLRIFTHVVGGNPGLGPTDVIKLGDEGLMGPDNVYIHFTNATNEQMRRIKDTGGSLSVACPIEMAMRHGMPPIQQALDAGIRPSLSSDVETTMAADMFTQMRSVFTLQRALLNERSIKGEKDLPPLLHARDVIEFATLQGARADGLEAKIGTLTPGKEADIVLLRTDLTNTLPFNNAYGAIVTAMDTSNVDTVFIAGKAVKRAGKLVGVDLDRVRRRGGSLARLSRRQARLAALGDRYEPVRALAHDPGQSGRHDGAMDRRRSSDVGLRTGAGMGTGNGGTGRAARGGPSGGHQTARIRRSGPPSRAGSLLSRGGARPRGCALRHAVLR